MRMLLVSAAAVLLAVATTWLVFECRRVAELAGAAEGAARQATARADLAEAAARTAVAEQAALRSSAAEAQAAALRLGEALARAEAQLATLGDVVRARREQEAARAAAAAEAAAAARAPMPEGVRLALATLHECLRLDGYHQQRFLSARALDGEGLHDVEMLDAAVDGLGVDLVRAKRMTAVLDRSQQRLTLTFLDGYRLVGAAQVPLPAGGWPLQFAPVDVVAFESRLPYLVRAEGLPPGEPGEFRPAGDLDPLTRRQWLERLDSLLAVAGTPEPLHVNRLRGLLDGYFTTVQLLATDGKHRLVGGVDAARCAVEVDEATGVVSLRLFDGVLRRGGTESTITAEGYRMLLPKLTPSRARELMLGMVVTK